MKLRRLVYVVTILFAILMLSLSLMTKREGAVLKEVIVYKTEKLDAIVDTVKQLMSTVEAKRQKVDSLRTYVLKVREGRDRDQGAVPTSRSQRSRELHVQTAPTEKQAPCRCEPKPSTAIPPGRYVIANVDPVIYSPENTCHPKPSDINIELNFNDSLTLGANNIQMILSNKGAVMTGPCFKTVTKKIEFAVERYALHCNASIAGPSAQNKLTVKQILIDLKPQASVRYRLKLLVNIDCDDITGIIELYLGEQMTNSARFKMTHKPLPL